MGMVTVIAPARGTATAVRHRLDTDNDKAGTAVVMVDTEADKAVVMDMEVVMAVVMEAVTAMGKPRAPDSAMETPRFQKQLGATVMLTVQRARVTEVQSLEEKSPRTCTATHICQGLDRATLVC